MPVHQVKGSSSAKDSTAVPIRSSPRKRKRGFEEHLEVEEKVANVKEAKSKVNGSTTTIKGYESSKRSSTKHKTTGVEIEESVTIATKNPWKKARKDEGVPFINGEDARNVPLTKSTPTKVDKKPQNKQTNSPQLVGLGDSQSNPKISNKKITKEIEVETSEGPKKDIPEVSNNKKNRRKRKTKEEKEAEAMPLAARSTGLKMFVGAHVSIAKGIENAVSNCERIGGNAFALFLKSQRKWENPPLKDENRDAFIKSCCEHNYDTASHVLPHGSYLVNLAQEEKDKAKQAYETFMDDLHRCEALGIKYYNFHPGTANQSPLSEAIGRVAAQLNRALSETDTVVPVLENMAGGRSVIGSRFSDLRDVIAGIKPEYQSRIGVCIDTCHAHAAGYDLRTVDSFKKVLKEFDETVGMKYLKALHLNDSKAPFRSSRDLHQNIGLGFLGLRAFHNVMNEARFQNLPLILETPCDVPDPSDPTGKKTIEDKRIWAREIKLLESLIGMDPESEEFKKLEKELSDQGREERVQRQKAQDSIDERKKKKAEKEREKGQRSLDDMIAGKKKNKQGVKSPLASEEEDEEDEGCEA